MWARLFHQCIERIYLFSNDPKSMWALVFLSAFVEACFKNLKMFDTAHSCNLLFAIHSPAIDSNPTSLNVGIPEETLGNLKRLPILFPQ
jgi:hypothetical protein